MTQFTDDFSESTDNLGHVEDATKPARMHVSISLSINQKFL